MFETELQIAPLSVNKAFKGRRFKTKDYVKYEKNVLLMLPKTTLPRTPLHVEMIFGFSSYASDVDNPTKLILDILCKKYGFDDKRIESLYLKKEITKKGREYIKIKIYNINEKQL